VLASIAEGEDDVVQIRECHGACGGEGKGDRTKRQLRPSRKSAEQ
jgi:hypothetical protein